MWQLLSDVQIWYNSKLSSQISDILAISTKFERSSELQAQGKGNEYNLNLVKEVGGSTYNSGAGADGYQMKEEFERAKEVIVQLDKQL